MVNIGDTVVVTIPTYWTPANNYTLAGLNGTIQNGLQQNGFRVLKIDDDSLSWLGMFGDRGNLVISVVPLSSAYASAQDVASIVASWAYYAGYVGTGSAVGRIAAYANPQDYQLSSPQYQDNLNAPSADRSNLPDLPKLADSSLLLFGGIALVAVLVAVSLRR